MQGDRKMSAGNVPLLDVANDSSAALLTAVVETVKWKHSVELSESMRPGQRVIIYPPELDRLQVVLSLEKSKWDVAGGQEEACERIVAARDSFEHQTIFFSSDQEDLKHHANPTKDAEWMATASQIATGYRRQVPENGPDVMKSESDSDNAQHGDVIPDGYRGISVNVDGDPIGTEHHMETSQADQMRREAASGAGGLRSGVGPGKTDTCVTKGHPF
jgi:hypothetical protein